MRIVGGSLGGRVLRAPRGADTRPTSEKVREAIFNILGPVDGAHVLDLFAGSGALGIEALSRGAAYVLFVDEGAEARALLRENTQTLGLAGVTRIFRRDATRLGPVYPVEPFTLAFLDPPYGKGCAEQALTSARQGGWLVPGSIVVVEEAVASSFKTPDGYEELERRAYDDTEFVFLRST